MGNFPDVTPPLLYKYYGKYFQTQLLDSGKNTLQLMNSLQGKYWHKVIFISQSSNRLNANQLSLKINLVISVFSVKSCLKK
jgi:hypothetical protein